MLKPRIIAAFFSLLSGAAIVAAAAKPDDPDEPISTAPVTLDRSAAAEKLREPPITDEDRDHWAFRPLTRPAPPNVRDSAWPTNDVDRFILAQLEAESLAPQPPAERRAWLRRVTFDLTGLPPTPADSAAFLADDSPQACQRVADRLLASQAYGERWGQHWLDLARFAETDGFEHDKVRPQAWRYRDWVIEALNADRPLDEFIRLQIAGDELQPDDPQAAVATGFLLAGPDMPDLNLKEERRHMVLNEVTSTVGAALLGLQVGCAQCHDHKYDPISQADFYRLRAIFETAELFETMPVGRVVHESGKTPVSYLMFRGDFRRPGPSIEPAFPRIANVSSQRIIPPPEGQAGSGRRSALAHWLTRPDQPLVTRVLANWIWQHHFGQGLSRTPGDFGVMGDTPSHPKLLDWLATELVQQGWSMKRIHRLLVTSATYRQASGPSSTQANGKPANSQRDAEAHWKRAVAADPENRWLARMNRQRLDGEAIRDAMLASADRLSAGRGGSGVMAPLPQELVASLLKGQWKVSPIEEEHRRRSVYLFVRRNLRYPLFEAFDRPDTNASCPRRNVSTTAPQALVLLNSEFSFSAARDLASYVLKESTGDLDARIRLVYDRTLSRPPTSHELQAAAAFLRAQTARLEQTPTDDLALPESAVPDDVSPREAAALVDLCLAMFNLNEFIYLD